MRIVVMSDSHRHEGNLFDIVEMHKEDADLFIFLGDGEDDIENVEIMYSDLRFEIVAGNCDFCSTKPMYKEISFAGKKIFFSHGHPFYVKHGYERIIEEARSREADIVLFGHTHNQYTEYDGKLCIMNPGAVANGEYGMIDIVNNQIMLLPCKM